MKPIKLTIEGVNSFTDEQTLDFESVGRDNLFCISGKTGAGKTTIFDSILLALYGKCGRGKLGDVINLSRKNARITFEFESNGDIYLVERKITRTKKKSAKSAGTAEPVEPDEPDEPDGEIAESADLPTEENSEENSDATASATETLEKKTDLLSPMSTGTGKCKLYKNGEPFGVGNESAVLAEIVGLTLDEFKNVYLLEQGEYAEFLKLTPPKQLETVGKIFLLNRFSDVFYLAHGEQIQAEKEMEIREEKIKSVGENSPAELKAVNADLSRLRAKNTALEKDIARARLDLDELSRQRDIYNSAMEKSRNVKRLALSLDAAKIELAAADDDCKAFSGSDEIEKTAAELRERMAELSRLNALDAECVRLVSEQTQKRELYETKRAATEKLDGEYKAKLAEVESIENSVKSTVAEFIDAAQRLESRSAAVISAIDVLSIGGEKITVSEVGERGFALKTELNDYKALAKSKADEESKRTEYVRACDDSLKKIESYSAAIRVAAQTREAAENAERDAQTRLTHAQTAAHAAVVRSELKAGDRCPVCGGVYEGGSSGGSSGDVEKAKAEHAAAKSALDAAIAQENKISRALDDEKAAFDRLDAARKAHETEIVELDGKMRGSGVVLDVYEKLLSLLRTVHECADKAEKVRAAAASKLPEIAKLIAERDGAESAADDCAVKLDKIKTELGDNFGKTNELIAQTRKLLEESETRLKEYNAKKSELNARLEGGKAKVKTLENELAAAQKDCPVDMPEFDEEKYAEKKAQFDGMNTEFNERETEIAVKNNNAELLAAKCEEIKKLDAQRTDFVKKYNVYGKIADATKSKALLNFVAEEYVYDFTAAASETLGELSGGKYSMNFDSANGFLIYDYLNGGKARKASTLSGGEMFLASLAVAIAIAAAQSKGDNAFFFLDEGFGTLDDELIDTVFGALSQLSAHCLVGVITHAGALIERMPAIVEVLEATDSMGSRIRS